MVVNITGATGFVGLNLQDYLMISHEINPLSIRYVPNQKFELKKDVIIHLAGKAHDLKKVANSQDYYEANCELTKQLFDAFLKSEASVFIFMSTVKAVEDKIKAILTEDFYPNPQTHYGIAKHRAEQYILSKELPKDKRVYILRPCMIHGEGNKGNLTLLYNFVKRGIPYPLGAYENKRSFLSIDNLCFVINELIEQNNIPSGIYHLADDESISTKNLITLISQVTNKKIFIWKIPKFIVDMVAKIGDYLPLPINTERVMKMTENYVVSNQKIKTALGKNLPISSKEGLIKTIQSFEK